MTPTQFSLRLAAFAVLAVSGCQQADVGDGPLAPAASTNPAQVEAEGLHNVYRISPMLFSGSSPEGEAGFRSLRKMGVKTILSVDGARPEVALAGKYGLRYVHVPVGYDGISRSQVLQMAKAARDLPGAIYIHCHHGKHRGPTAAAAVHLCMDEKCSVEQAVAEMQRAGTDRRYKGLYAVPKDLVRPTQEELNRLAAEFPEVAPVPAFAQIMVEVDARWDNLKLMQSEGWKTPKLHPDLDPANEALQVVEHFREASRLKQARDRPEEFRRLLQDAEEATTALERVLREGKGKPNVDLPSANEAFRKAGAVCVQCHTKYRDLPP